MIRNTIASMANPKNWIFFLPQISIKTKVVQYPGTKPTAEYKMLARHRFWKASKASPIVADRLELLELLHVNADDAKPMGQNNLVVLRPTP